jgi:hypothetical protein
LDCESDCNVIEEHAREGMAASRCVQEPMAI